MAAVNPGGANDQPPRRGVTLQFSFAEQFGLAISLDGVDRVVSTVGAFDLPLEHSVEDEIGADVNECCAGIAAQGREFPDGKTIDGVGLVQLLLAKIDFGMGGAVQHQRRFVVVHYLRQHCAVRDVELRSG